ncbi:hypothetical protein OSTOST_19102 [Ostertagia ostertagi]
MTVSVWVWLRGEFLLESFLPLDFSTTASPSSASPRNEDSPGPSTAIDGAHALIDECQARNWDRLSVLEWSNIVDEIGLDNTLSEAVYRNASGDEANATLSCLSLHMLLVGLEYFSYEADEAIAIRGDVVTAMVHQQMGEFPGFLPSPGHKLDQLLDEFIGVLCRCALGCSRTALKNDRLRFSNQQLKKLTNSIDLLFEGMMEDDEADEHHDEIVKASDIIQKLWLEDNEVSTQKN